MTDDLWKNAKGVVGWPLPETRLDKARLWLMRRVICPHKDTFTRSTGYYCSTCLRRWPLADEVTQ